MTPVHFEECPSQTLSIPQQRCSQRPLVLGFCLGASLLWDDGYTNNFSKQVHQGQMQGQVFVGRSLLWQQDTDMEK